jgi:MGT family glycosyltransferase
MRVLFTTLPGYGSFQPLAPVARALLAASHDVAFAASATFCPVVARAGFHCLPAGLDWSLDDRDAVFTHVRTALGPEARPFSQVRDVFAGYMAPRMVPDLLAIAEEWPFDVLVRDPLEFGGCVAAEVLDVPHVACGPLFCFWDGAWHATPGEVAKPELDGVRAAHGLRPDPELAMLHHHLYLACVPRAFPGPELTIPPTVHFLRPVPFDQLEGEALPAWIEELPPRPIVHASLGTIFHRTPGAFEAILEALRDEPINLLLAIGRDQDPARFGAQPPHIRIERYLPHDLLLPRCDAVITHGGYGSLMAGLDAGVPMVVIPLAGGDQAGNANRCVALGMARVVAADQRTPEMIRAAVRDVLADPRYGENATRLRDQMRALPGLEQAVRLLEQLPVDTEHQEVGDAQGPVHPRRTWVSPLRRRTPPTYL